MSDRHPMTGNEMSGSAAGGSERHTYDVVLAFGPAEGESSGIHMGLGTILMLINVVLIWGYTLGCHSCRHIMGGRLRHFS